MMAKPIQGRPNMVPYIVPSGTSVNAGDVVIVNDLPMVAHADCPLAPGYSQRGELSSSGFIYLMAADAAYPVGTRVFWNPTSQQVTTGPSGTVPFGQIVAGPTGYASDGGPVGPASFCWVAHNPGLGSGVIYSVGAIPNDTITNTAAETPFLTTAVIPASALQANDVVKVRFAAVVNSQSGTNTHQVKLKVLTAANTFTAVINTGPLNAAANTLVFADLDIIMTSVGNNGTFLATGYANDAGALNTTLTSVFVANTVINTNEAITIEATVLPSAASVNNVVQLIELGASLSRK